MSFAVHLLVSRKSTATFNFFKKLFPTAFSIKSCEPILRVGGAFGVHNQRQRGGDQMFNTVICHRLCASRGLAGKRRPGI